MHAGPSSTVQCVSSGGPCTVTATLPPTRHPFNRLLGQLHHCLQHRQSFEERKAFPQTLAATA
jgi:hypothetical protein